MITRLLFAAIAFVYEQVESDGSVPVRVAIGRALDLLFWFGAIGLLAGWAGVFQAHEIEERGYAAIVPLILALLWVLVKGLLCVALPALGICSLLRQRESLLPRVVVYGVAASAAAWMYHEREIETQAAAARRTALESQKQLDELRASEQRQADEMQRRDDEAHREDHLKRLMTAAARAHERWQEDLRAAGTIGRDDVPPPVLSVTETAPHIRRVRNDASETLCVQLVRTQRIGADVYHHCTRDLRKSCVDIAPGSSASFSLPPDETEYGCHDAYLEYRIGDAWSAGPSAWSYSAVRSLENERPDYRARYARLSVSEMKTETARIEALLAEQDRAARWRRVFTPQRQTAGDGSR